MESEYTDRLSHPAMEYYRYVYKDSQLWNGIDSLEGKTVISYLEQGYGDIIQFARYLPFIAERCKKLILHCPKSLHRLFEQFGYEILDKDNSNLPDHDYHTLSLSLPFIIGDWKPPMQYINIAEKTEMPDSFSTMIKIGIAWEGSSENLMSERRNCPLKYFKEQENVALFMIQKEVTDATLLTNATDLNLNGTEIDDFYDVAKLINTMDFVVSVDTACLHLAGAMGKLTFGLLACDCDGRWGVSTWYNRIVMIRQANPNDWENVFKSLIAILKTRSLLN